jgi:two-component system heavy metal sensor histidine kinase CusS
LKLEIPRLQSSLAVRLITLFCCGSVVIMIAVTSSLYHTLRMQVEEQDAVVLRGKTRVIEHLLEEINDPARLDGLVERVSEMALAHPNLSIGLRAGGTWLVAPRGEIAATANRFASADPGPNFTTEQVGKSTWWMTRIQRSWRGASPAAADVVVSLDVTNSQRLIRAEAINALLVAVLGSLLSGALAFFVVRRALAPIARLARRAEHVTAKRLGTALPEEDAPTEIRGLVQSINLMLGRLADSFRSLEEFSADIAHELRTPINNLLLQTQVTLSRPRDADAYREALLSNLEELQRLDRMVSDMLFLARADRGVLSVAAETVDLAREAASVAEYFEPAASERSQQILIAGRSTVRGDRLMIRRAITNLLSNAVRYAPPGECIKVNVESALEASFVAVSNTCSPPIQTEELPRLFGRFSQREKRRDDDGQGAGLGLAIVESIMRLHGGAAQVESGDFGVRFTLRFPPGSMLTTT